MEAETRVERLERLVELHDRERREAARALHDGVAQTLAALSMELFQTGGRAAGAGAARELLATALRELRAVSALLHPTLLDQAGPAAALRSLAGPLVEVTAPGDVVPPDRALAMFHAARGLTDGASHARVELREDGTLEVERDGAASAAAVEAAATRVAAVGGSLDVAARPGATVYFVRAGNR